MACNMQKRCKLILVLRIDRDSIIRKKCKVPMHLKKSSIIKVLFLIAVAPMLCVTAMADYDPDKKITLEAKNQPLSQVFHRLSQSTGYTFTYNDEWADLNISVNVVNLDLEKTLRKILSKHNFAILYETDGNIRIMIYDDTSEMPDARTTHDRSGTEYVNVGSAEPVRDEPLKGENGENETATEPESSDDPEEELENDTEDEKEITDEDERASGQHIE